MVDTWRLLSGVQANTGRRSKGHTMTISKARQAEVDSACAAARDTLRELFPMNTSVPMMVTHVSSSGMSRHIAVFGIGTDSASGRPFVRNVSRLVAAALGYRLNRDGNALVVGGCGMSMTFAVGYSMGRALYANTHTCTGTRDCRSNDHTNEWATPDYRAGRLHSDGGYALNSHAI